nr:uncharacterized protein LOC132782891 isoform X2 [Anolis sagrei ordinatus]
MIGGKEEEEMPLRPREELRCGPSLFCTRDPLLGEKETGKSTPVGRESILIVGPIHEQVAVIATALEKKLNFEERLRIWRKYREFARVEGTIPQKPEYRPQLALSVDAKEEKASISAANDGKKKPNCAQKMSNWWKSLKTTRTTGT